MKIVACSLQIDTTELENSSNEPVTSPCSHVVDLLGKKQILRSNTVRQVRLDFALQKMRCHGQAFLLPWKEVWKDGRKEQERECLDRESNSLLLEGIQITRKSMYVFKIRFFFFFF